MKRATKKALNAFISGYKQEYKEFDRSRWQYHCSERYLVEMLYPALIQMDDVRYVQSKLNFWF